VVTPAYRPERRRLTDTLRSLRTAADLSGERLAAAAGWDAGQSKVSKIERGKQLPSDQDLTAWAEVTGATARLNDLHGMLRRARVESASLKDAYHAVGASGFQTDIMTVEADSTRIAEFQTAMMSGLVQTPEYAREFLHLPCGPLSYGQSEADIEAMIATRLQRQQQALYNPDKQVQIVMLEAALRTRSVSAPTMAGQLDRLISVSGLAAVELSIVSFTAQVPVWPLSGFRLYDDRVIVETLVSEQPLDDRDHIVRYGKYLELLREAAVTGPEATALIRAAMQAL
jgi:transcriptional regulator with XRE-family HTH domain